MRTAGVVMNREETGSVGVSRWDGAPTADLRERWDVPALEAHASLGSTSDRLRALFDEGAEPWTVVVADAQTAGRGRGGSGWHSPAGMGVWMSVLLPSRPRGRMPSPLSPIVVGLAVARGVDGVVPGPGTRIKWPNDIHLQGRKVGGILCEGVGGGRIVAGVGINVRQERRDFPVALRSRAISLEMAAGARVSRRRLARRILEQMRHLWRRGGDGLEGELAREMEFRDALRGRRVRCRGGVEGRAAGVAPDGALLVEVDDGETVRIVAGGVRIVGDPERDEVEDGSEKGGGSCSS